MATGTLGLSDKQQALRQQGIGASEVAAVVGLAPGAIDVWQRKVGLAEPFEGSSLTEFGHRVERVIGEAWSERHPGVRIYTPGTLRHPKHEWALASPDRVVAPVGLGRPARETWQSLLEIKTVFFSGNDYGEEGTDQVPEKHLVQVAWQLAVTGLQNATLVALVNGDYREYPIARDLELEEMLLSQAGAWWQRHVVEGEAPPSDGSEAYAGYLRRRYPADMLPPIELTPELDDLVAKVKDAKARLKAVEAEESALTAQLKASIGEAAGILGACTWKANKGSLKTDYEGLVEELFRRLSLPEADRDAIVRPFVTTKPGARVLRFTKEK